MIILTPAEEVQVMKEVVQQTKESDLIDWDYESYLHDRLWFESFQRRLL